MYLASVRSQEQTSSKLEKSSKQNASGDAMPSIDDDLTKPTH